MVLSRDLSPWTSELLFSVSKPVPEEAMTTLSGTSWRNYSKVHSSRQEAGTRKCSGLHASAIQDQRFLLHDLPEMRRGLCKTYVVGVAKTS
ncbi:hydrolase [Mesorhizobium atlanticum]|uniref:hydrolase n=1 Tax=Mesorhizobium atlanticum TaxID=2233532 RepID=UPI003CCB42E2